METNKSSCLRVYIIIFSFFLYSLVIYIAVLCVSDGMSIWIFVLLFDGDLSCAKYCIRVHCDDEESKTFPNGRLHFFNSVSVCVCEYSSNKKGNKIRIRYRRRRCCIWFALFCFLFVFILFSLFFWERHLSHYRWPCHHFFSSSSFVLSLKMITPKITR